MLGHAFFNSWKENHEVKVTLKGDLNQYKIHTIFNEENSLSLLNALDFDNFSFKVQSFMPDCIVNCTGVTKQLSSQDNIVNTMLINAILPHRLEELCENLDIRLIQLSTDCIFSGKKGLYEELDPSDAEDLYGKSKFLGEVTGKNSLTIRKSTIGLELSNKHGLIEWFLNQRDTVQGYSNAIYSGFTSLCLASIVEEIISNYPDLNGVLNIASKPISKYDLLLNLRDRIDDFNVNILEDGKIKIDRSLNPDKFKRITSIKVPTWDSMLNDLAEEINKRKYDSRK